MTNLTVSHYMPADHGTHVDFLVPWTRRIEAACPTLRFDIHCEGSPLGLLENQFSQVASGVVDIAHSPASLPAERFRLTNLMNLPFLVEDSQEGTDRLWAAYENCPSSNDLRLFGLWKIGVSGSVFGLI